MTPPARDEEDEPDHPGVPRPEGSSEEWSQRERYRELLEELRTIIPGVQVLFAFLLTVPFSSRFGDLDALGRQAFTVSLVAAALAAVVFLTPAAYHRVNDRHARARRIAVSVRAQLGGMVLLASAIAIAVFVVTRFIFSTTVGGVLGGVVVLAVSLMWWVLPRADHRHAAETAR